MLSKLFSELISSNNSSSINNYNLFFENNKFYYPCKENYLNFNNPSKLRYVKVILSVTKLSSGSKPLKVDILDNFNNKISFLIKKEKAKIRGNSITNEKKDIRIDTDIQSEVHSATYFECLNSFFAEKKLNTSLGLNLNTFSIVDFTDDKIYVEFLEDSKSLSEIINSELNNYGIEINIHFKFDKSSPMEHHFNKKYNVLWKFYHRKFKNSAAWLDAMITYETTCAIWSMAGNVIGLGDRHLENILINMKTGLL